MIAMDTQKNKPSETRERGCEPMLHAEGRTLTYNDLLFINCYLDGELPHWHAYHIFLYLNTGHCMILKYEENPVSYSKLKKMAGMANGKQLKHVKRGNRRLFYATIITDRNQR